MKNLILFTICALIFSGAGCDQKLTSPSPVVQNPKTETDANRASTTTELSNKTPTANKTLVVTTTLNTPETVLEAFTQALETNNAPAALKLIAEQEKPYAEELFQEIDLPALARDYRQFPPQRIDIPDPNPKWATFLTKNTASGQAEDHTISLHLEDGNWKIVSF